MLVERVYRHQMYDTLHSIDSGTDGKSVLIEKFVPDSHLFNSLIMFWLLNAARRQTIYNAIGEESCFENGTNSELLK